MKYSHCTRLLVLLIRFDIDRHIEVDENTQIPLRCVMLSKKYVVDADISMKNPLLPHVFVACEMMSVTPDSKTMTDGKAR